jgi:hypothetical protein
MNKRPGHVEVRIEVNYCSFCDRVRNLRVEEHHLGTLVRTVVTCETCHRTLSSTMGVATVEAPENEAAPEAAAPEADAKPEEAKPQPAKLAAARKQEAASPKPKAASKKARTAKPK